MTEDKRNARQRFASLLWRLGQLEEAASARRSFRARAYTNAVWALDDLAADLGEDAEAIVAVRDIGPGVAKLIQEFRINGALGRLQALATSLPRDARELRRLPRMTPTKLRYIKAMGIDTAADLVKAAEGGDLATVPGVGRPTSELWSERLLAGVGGEPIAQAAARAARWADHLERHIKGSFVHVSGGVRRLDELVGRLDLVVTGGDGLREFLQGSALVQGPLVDKGSYQIVALGGPLTVHRASNATLGSVLVESTGPPEHLRRLRQRAEGSALPIAGTETGVYETLELEWVSPPARSDDLTVPADLVRLDQIRGDFHIHSDWSPDGRQDLRSIALAAVARGYDYIAITDHAVGLRFGGLTTEDLTRQRHAIDELREEFPDLVLLHGVELNIGRDGSLDYEPETLAGLEFRIAAVHSYFNLEMGEQTDRLLHVINDPFVHAVAHLTGRRIGNRPPLRLDLPALFEAAAQQHTALEVNGHLDRLDLSSDHCRLASEFAVEFMANSDAHHPREPANISHAVGVLQRGRVEASNVVNTWPASEVLAWLDRDVD